MLRRHGRGVGCWGRPGKWRCTAGLWQGAAQGQLYQRMHTTRHTPLALPCRFLERVVATRAAEKAAAPQRPPNPPPPKGGDAAGGAMRSPRSPRPMLLGHIERSMTLPTLRPLRSFNGVTVDKGELAGGPGR